MSFVPLKEFLHKAFDRIDESHVLEQKRNSHDIQKVIHVLFPYIPEECCEYRNRVLVVYTSSPILKQKIFLSKNIIIQRVQTELPHSVIRDIVFKGPRL